MLPIDPRALGIIILSLLALLVVVKRVATGTVLGDRPQGGLGLWLSHVYNLSFLLVVNPLAGLLLVARRLALDPTHLAVQDPRALALCQLVGLLLSVAGYALMAWALLGLRRNYQPGGCAPRAGDRRPGYPRRPRSRAGRIRSAAAPPRRRSRPPDRWPAR